MFRDHPILNKLGSAAHETDRELGAMLLIR